jgi:hypothetical protein
MQRQPWILLIPGQTLAATIHMSTPKATKYNPQDTTTLHRPERQPNAKMAPTASAKAEEVLAHIMEELLFGYRIYTTWEIAILNFLRVSE